MISAENVVQILSSSLEAHKRDHDKSVVLIESLCNTLTKISFYKPIHTDKILSDYMDSSRLRQNIEEDYFEQREKLAKTRRQMGVSLHKLRDTIKLIQNQQLEIASLPSCENLEEMYRSMTQQSILEETSINILDSMMEHGDVDTDAFVTIIASFKFSPYCNQASILTLLESIK